MKQMTVIARDRVGVLADISYLLGKAKINIESVSAVSSNDKAILTFLLKDEKRAAQLLRHNGYHVLESEILVVRLKDEPGALSSLSSRLVEAKISISSLYIVAKEAGTSIVALKVDKPKKAKKLLAPYVAMD
jgi:hypothetical protein